VGSVYIGGDLSIPEKLVRSGDGVAENVHGFRAILNINVTLLNTEIKFATARAYSSTVNTGA